MLCVYNEMFENLSVWERGYSRKVVRSFERTRTRREREEKLERLCGAVKVLGQEGRERRKWESCVKL